jgi:hypothetical protein
MFVEIMRESRLPGNVQVLSTRACCDQCTEYPKKKIFESFLPRFRSRDETDFMLELNYALNKSTRTIYFK